MVLAPDGKIYKHIYAANSYTNRGYDDNAFSFDYLDLIDKLNLGRINNPNSIGLGSNIDTNYISNYSYKTAWNNGFSSLPDFPSYYFYNPKSGFKYSGACINVPITFYNNNTGIDSLRWHFLNDGQTAVGGQVQNSYNTAGNYAVQCIAYYNNTSDTSTHCVNIAGQGNSNLPKHIIICEGSDTLVNGLQPFGYQYKWNTGDTTSALHINKAGQYVLTYNTPCGFVYDTLIASTVFCNMYYELPNVFTPNGDNVNDLFTIALKNTKNINYHIYNRWGNEIITKNEDVNILTAQKYELWNGLINNEESTNGTYYYIIKLTPFKGNEIVLKGYLNLFR